MLGSRRRRRIFSLIFFAYPGQFAEVVGVEEELLEGPGVAVEVLGDGGEGAVALVHVLHLPVAPLEDGNALEHLDFLLGEHSKKEGGKRKRRIK